MKKARSRPAEAFALQMVDKTYARRARAEVFTLRAVARRLQPSVLALGLSTVVIAQPPPPPTPPLVWAAVKPIDPPATPLATEAASAAVTRFSFIAYGDTRSSGQPDAPGDGDILQEHTRVMDGVLAKVHHFVVVQVDGDRLSLEVIGTGPAACTPYNGSAKIALSGGAS